MADNAAVAEFKEGIQLLQQGYPAEAHGRFQRAVELEKQNAYYLSFLGVSEARGKKNWAAAADHCETAIGLKRNEGQFYLNLAEVYLSAGRRADAVAVLDRGLIYVSDDPRLNRARAKLGRRRSSVLPFLDRGHLFNRILGKLRHRTSTTRLMGDSIGTDHAND
jgi:Flp pilus assembly protein TadD